MPFAVFAHILKLEARRQVEVELHGRKLPQTAENIDELYIDLRAVEGRFARKGFEREPAIGEHLLQRPFGMRPILRRAEKIAALLRVARGKLDAILLESE